MKISNDLNLKHDVKSNIAALVSACEVLDNEWENDPLLVEQIILLSFAKLEELRKNLEAYHLSK